MDLSSIMKFIWKEDYERNSFRLPKFISPLSIIFFVNIANKLSLHSIFSSVTYFTMHPPADRYWYHENSKPTTFERNSIKISLHEHDNLISFSILMLSAFLAPWHENCWLQNITRDETVWENTWCFIHVINHSKCIIRDLRHWRIMH